MSIRKICPTSVSGARATDSCTQPVPSSAAWVAGFASTANTLAAGTATVRVALTFSWSTVGWLVVGFTGAVVVMDIVGLRWVTTGPLPASHLGYERARRHPTPPRKNSEDVFTPAASEATRPTRHERSVGI